MKKRKVLTAILLSLILVFSFSSSAFATMQFDYHLLRIERGTSITVTLNTSGNDPFWTCPDDGLIHECEEIANGLWEITVTAPINAPLGVTSLCSFGVTCQYDTLYAFFVDTTAPVLYSINKTKTTATIYWKGTDVGRYQVQYRTKGGTWKTAQDFTKKTSCKITNLVKGKTYQFRVRAVNYDYDWGEFYGDWSNYKTVKLG